MTSKLLINRRVNIGKDYIRFLNFLHPHYTIIDDLKNEINPDADGIIFIGQYDDNTLDTIKKFNLDWIIVNPHHFDVDLTTNENLIKNLLPLHYAKIKTAKDKEDFLFACNAITYDVLLEKIKMYLIGNIPLSLGADKEQLSAYNLYQAILSTPDNLNRIFFNLVTKNNVSYITSSLLTFLCKVQSQNTRGASIYYSRLIMMSNQRYGKRIKSAVYKFVNSSANKEIALYQLVMDLNGAR